MQETDGTSAHGESSAQGNESDFVREMLALPA